MKSWIGRGFDIVLFGMFFFLGLSTAATFPEDWARQSWSVIVADISTVLFCASILSVPYYLDYRFGKIFNPYLLNNPEGLGEVTGLPSKAIVRSKLIRGLIYLGVVIHYAYKFNVLMLQQLVILKSEAFHEKVNCWDQLVATIMVASLIVFIIGITLPYFFV